MAATLQAGRRQGGASSRAGGPGGSAWALPLAVCAAVALFGALLQLGGEAARGDGAAGKGKGGSKRRRPLFFGLLLER